MKNFLVFALVTLCLTVVTTQDIDQCASNPCMHDGTCVETSDRSFDCQCHPGFGGDDCQIIDNDQCLSDPCQNGGVCFGGRCTCLPGFTGHHCQEHLDGVCLSNPCLNGGTCTPTSDGDDYTCTCLSLFTGSDCNEHRLNTTGLLSNETGCCLSQPCYNGGTCVEQGGGFSCHCTGRFSGALCEVMDNSYCTSAPCQHGGTCNPVSNTCSCQSGFGGAECEVFTENACLSDPCIYGDCINGADSYTCECLNHFSGTNCQIIGQPCSSARRGTAETVTFIASGLLAYAMLHVSVNL